MITKEQFIKVISTIQLQHEIDSEIDISLQKICGSHVCFQTENKIYSMVDELLAIIFEDKEDWIPWWLYETSNKVITYKDGTTKDVTLVGDLYDFLIENVKEK